MCPLFFQEPSSVRWHPEGIVFAVGGSHGELEVLDLALNAIRLISPSQWPNPGVTSDFLSLGEHWRCVLPQSKNQFMNPLIQ
jgi:hypothetical protein